MKIIVDAFGGDNAPQAIVEASINACNNNADLYITLVGKEDKIKEQLVEFKYLGNQINIINANEIISCDESPAIAIKTKRESSLVVAFETLKNQQEYDAFVSAGSTGAVLTGALLKLGRIKGISRPALAPLLPNKKGGKTLLIDCGANVDCKAAFLADFAMMGSVYMQCMCDIKKPKVALINVGTEDKKGNELTHEVFDILKQKSDVNFVGNMEARDILSGDYDVLVADGFVGNVALKSIEGTASFIMSSIKTEIKNCGLFAKIGALLLKKSLNNIKSKMDYKAVGGSPFLGVEKVVVKAHGSSDARCFCSAINLAVKLVNEKLVDKIKSNLPKVEEN